jgi:hypothetical protein
VKWRTDQLPPGIVSGTASADLDADGRDEAITVVGRKLVCLGEAEGHGVVKWTIDLQTECGPPSVGVLGKGGPVSILLAGTDGVIYCIQSSSTADRISFMCSLHLQQKPFLAHLESGKSSSWPMKAIAPTHRVHWCKPYDD